MTNFENRSTFADLTSLDFPEKDGLTGQVKTGLACADVKFKIIFQNIPTSFNEVGKMAELV